MILNRLFPAGIGLKNCKSFRRMIIIIRVAFPKITLLKRRIFLKEMRIICYIQNSYTRTKIMINFIFCIQFPIAYQFNWISRRFQDKLA